MSDVVPSMRAIIADTDRYPRWLRSLLTEAADEIERLRAASADDVALHSSTSRPMTDPEQH